MNNGWDRPWGAGIQAETESKFGPQQRNQWGFQVWFGFDWGGGGGGGKRVGFQEDKITQYLRTWVSRVREPTEYPQQWLETDPYIIMKFQLLKIRDSKCFQRKKGEKKTENQNGNRSLKSNAGTIDQCLQISEGNWFSIKLCTQTNYQSVWSLQTERTLWGSKSTQVGVKVGNKYILLIKAIVIIYLAIIHIDFNI